MVLLQNTATIASYKNNDFAGRFQSGEKHADNAMSNALYTDKQSPPTST